MICSYLIYSSFVIVCTGTMQTNVDIYRFTEGEHHFNIMNQRSALPEYSKCWTDTIQSITVGCKKLTDKIQTRLSLYYLNCFLEGQNRLYYPCLPDQSVDICTHNMTEGDRSSLATFFIHTQNICYFLEIKYWNQHTEKTIEKLSDASEEIATQLEMSYNLQNDMVQKQMETMNNQKEILNQTINLNGTIFSTSSSITKTMLEFQRVTVEQKISTRDIFKRVSKLYNLSIKVIDDIYSALFYSVLFLIYYLTTSTPRTSKARLSLFAVLILNYATEKLLFYYKTLPNSDGIEKEVNSTEIYELHWVYRKVYMLVAFCILFHSVWSYTDANDDTMNILYEIKAELKSLVKHSNSNRNSHDTTEEDDDDDDDGSCCSMTSSSPYRPSNSPPSNLTSGRPSMASLLEELKYLKKEGLYNNSNNNNNNSSNSSYYYNNNTSITTAAAAATTTGETINNRISSNSYISNTAVSTTTTTTNNNNSNKNSNYYKNNINFNNNSNSKNTNHYNNNNNNNSVYQSSSVQSNLPYSSNATCPPLQRHFSDITPRQKHHYNLRSSQSSRI
ncbi:uncharacterized protein LOC115210763 [Argonauta hians]